MRRIVPFATLIVVALFVIRVGAMQAPQPSCDSIVLDYVFLGGGGVRGGGGPRIPGEPLSYKIALNRAGNSTLHRNGAYFKFLPDSGHDFIAAVDLDEFSKVCQMADEPKFESLQSAYGSHGGTDGTEKTVAVTSGTRKKSVYERDSRGPSELKAFQQAVTAVAERMVWTGK